MITCSTCRSRNRCPERSRNYPCRSYKPWEPRQELRFTVKPPYLTGDKYVRVFIQPVITIVQAEDGFYIWLAKIFGLALLAESVMMAIVFWTM